MENSLGSAIEKIKRDEETKEAQLKAIRELEATKALAERSIREVSSQIRKLEVEMVALTKKTDELHAQLTIQKIRRDALVAQLCASKQKFVELRAKAEHVTSELHDLRSTYCKTVQEISDSCDVWALLTKPTMETLPRAIKKPQETNNEQTAANEARIKSVIERRDKAMAERDRLKSEPDTGEEFVRIKNALRYSMEMMANLRK